MAKTISDEVLVAALVEHGTIRDAAKAAGIGERAFYERMKAGAFINLYNNAKADILRGAVLNTTRQLQGAIDCIAQIMNDKTVNPATRLQAAQTIITNAGKLQARLTEDDARAMRRPPSPIEEEFDELCAGLTRA